MHTLRRIIALIIWLSLGALLTVREGIARLGVFCHVFCGPSVGGLSVPIDHSPSTENPRQLGNYELDWVCHGDVPVCCDRIWSQVIRESGI